MSGKLRLTSQQKEVVRLILKTGFQSLSELRVGPLRAYRRDYCYKFLKKLEDRNVLTRSELRPGLIAGWVISTKFKHLLVNSGWEASSIPKSPSYRGSYEHDLILRTLQSIFERSYPITSWTSEMQIRSKKIAFRIGESEETRRKREASIPDGVFTFRHKGEIYTAALELERTQRSKKRLFQKIEQRLLSKDYNFVFYVVEKASLEKALRSVVADVLGRSIEVSIAHRLNGIYFALLSEVQENPRLVAFRGLKNTFQFEDKSPE